MVSITSAFKGIYNFFTPKSKGKEIIYILEKIAKGEFDVEIKIPDDDSEHTQILKGLKLTLQELRRMERAELRRRRQIMEANKKLRELDKRKQEFMELASHQLKTPLASMRLALDLLAKRSSEWDESDRMIIEELEESYKNLDKIIHSILASVKVDELIVAEPKMQMVSIGNILSALEKQFKVMFDKKGVEFVIEKPRPAFKIKTDLEFVMKILTNLVENAYKYTDKGYVKVFVDRKPKSIEFVVEDTGIGVPLSEQKRIFDKLFRASNVKNLSDASTGLGLYYTRELVKILKGKIWFESEEGRGTKFYVSLPV